MKTFVKTTVVLVTIILCVTTLSAQGLKMETSGMKKHEFRPFYGTSYAASDSDIFAETLSNGLLGIAQKSETNTWGMIGLGYRYHINKISLGVDLGFSSADEKLFKKDTDTEPFETKKIKRFFILPTATYRYYKGNLIELYGSASIGAIMENIKSDRKEVKKEDETSFGYQITPIGLRIGSNTVGGFVELGYGQKGLINAGLSFRF